MALLIDQDVNQLVDQDDNLLTDQGGNLVGDTLFAGLFDISGTDLFDLGGGLNLFDIEDAAPILTCLHIDDYAAFDLTITDAPAYDLVTSDLTC